MNIEVPPVARRLFARLSKGDNLILSRNGPANDAELFAQVEADEDHCLVYFGVIGYHLMKGDGYYCFSLEDEAQQSAEAKIDKLIRLVRLLDFLSTYVESFTEGQIFPLATLLARCQGDPKIERFLQGMGKGSTFVERLEYILQSLVRQGYLSEYDSSRREFRVLSAIHYLMAWADRIEIHDEQTGPEVPDEET